VISVPPTISNEGPGVRVLSTQSEVVFFVPEVQRHADQEKDALGFLPASVTTLGPPGLSVCGSAIPLQPSKSNSVNVNSFCLMCGLLMAVALLRQA
jgi:hypothetical protein